MIVFVPLGIEPAAKRFAPRFAPWHMGDEMSEASRDDRRPVSRYHACRDIGSQHS